MDIKIQLNDSLLNKIINSVNYPLVILNHDEVFEPFKALSRSDSDRTLTLSKKELNSLIDAVYRPNERNISTIYDNFDKVETEEVEHFIKAIYSEWIESLTLCLRAYEEAIQLGEEKEFVWPEGESQESLQLKKKLEPNEALKEISMIATKTHLRRATVELTEAPKLKFENGKFTIDNIKIRASVRVEIWQSYNWYKCYRYCTRWETVRKWNYVAITKNGLKVKSQVDVGLKTSSNVLTAHPSFKELRIDHNVFNIFDLSSLANKFISNIKIEVYDANKFTQTIPLIEKDFKISAFEINSSNSRNLTCDITFEKIV